MKYTIEERPELRGYTVEWAEPDNYYLSHRNRVFHSSDLVPPFTVVADIDAPLWKRVASRVRLAQRLIRFLVTNVIPLENGDIFVTFDRSVGIIRDGRYLALKGLKRPCRILRGACAVDKMGTVFFGEYLSNNERSEMRIYRYDPGSDSVRVAYTFAAGSIRHIHGIYFDEFSNSMFCLTGDRPSECRILQTFDGFETVKVVGEGDETWRAVSILFAKDALLYGTDAEYRSNQIFRIDRIADERTSVGEVNGTVFYSKKLGDDMFFATTAENAPAQSENVAAIWRQEETHGLEELISFEKDRWNGTLFMFGLIHFPVVNRIDNELYFSVVGVQEDDRTYSIKRTQGQD
jgi:hypothetical protein